AFVVGDLSTHAFGENFRSSTRQRIETGAHQLAEDLFIGLSVEIGEERNLNRREAFEVHLWADLFEAAEQLRVVVPWQIRMQSIDQMNFGQRLVPTLAQLVPRLLERHRVRAGIARLQPRKRAKQT